MKKNEVSKIPEIVIPKDYDVNEYLDIDNGDFVEEPIFTEEVRILFE